MPVCRSWLRWARIMAVTILCPNLRCRTVLLVPEKVRGKKVRCSQCATAFLVPAQQSKAEPKRGALPAQSSGANLSSK